MYAPFTHHPLDYHFGFLQITGFGIAVLAGFLVAQVVTARELTRRGYGAIEAAAIPDVVLAAVFGTLIGAKVYYVILTRDPGALFSRGGFVFWGGFVGAVLLCYLTIRVKKINFIRISDAAAIAIMAGYCVGRTGCWAVGDDYGRPWNGFLSVKFPEGAPPSTAAAMQRAFGIPIPAGVSPETVMAVHPSQLYEVSLAFLFFLVLWRMRGHKHAEGWLFGLYCVLAGAERFIVEFVRAKDDRFFGSLTLAQCIAIGIAVVGAWWMLARSQPGPGRPGIYPDGNRAAPA